MAKIEFRRDCWFKGGKDAKERSPFAYQSYQAKQYLKRKLNKLNKKNLSRNALEKEIYKIEAREPLKGHLFLDGDGVFVPTYGMPGRAYLGRVVE